MSAYRKAFTCKCFINTVLNKQFSGAGFEPRATSVQPLLKIKGNSVMEFWASITGGLGGHGQQGVNR